MTLIMECEMENEVKHACINCIFKEECGCFLFNKHYLKQDINQDNKCPQFLSNPDYEEIRRGN